MVVLELKNTLFRAVQFKLGQLSSFISDEDLQVVLFAHADILEDYLAGFDAQNLLLFALEQVADLATVDARVEQSTPNFP